MKVINLFNIVHYIMYGSDNMNKENDKLVNENENDILISETDKSINDELVKDIQVRLRKIQGQVKGIEKMVSSEACCKNILVQVAAVRAAMNKVGGLVLERYTKNCLLNENDEIEKEKVEELVSTFLMFLK